MKSRNASISLVTSIIFTLFVELCAGAQQPPNHSRPKIALVLEGGGALGLAHVGVIQWLEEHHVPVDYVAGTSMGGLLGGMYASGKTPQELEHLITNIDWDEVLRDQVQYQDLSFRRKEDRRDYPNSIEFGLKKGVRLPAGFNGGYRVGLLFDRELLPYSNIKSFDELPIPFRCVAVDMVARREHVFKDGPLPEALRATMSLPAIFSPVRADDRLYIDGGLLNNLPVDVGRAMGADIVLAVHLQTRSLDAKEPLSSFGVLAESISVVIAANELRSLEKADIVINVEGKDYTATDYDKVKQLIKAGQQAAQAKSKILEVLALNDVDWQQFMAAREARRITTVPMPQFVEITGTMPGLEKDIRRNLSDLVGKPIDTGKIERDLTHIVGSGRFASLDYRMDDHDGVAGLAVTAYEKEYAPPLLNPLIAIDGSQPKNVRFSLGARITNFGADYASEWRTDALIGSEFGLATEYYRPFTPGRRFFVAPRAQADSAPFDIYNRGSQVAEYRSRKVSGALDLGITFSRNSQFRVGYEVGRISFSNVIGDAQFRSNAERLGVSSARYRLDRLDDPIIPRTGTSLDLAFRWTDSGLNGNRRFPAAETDIRTFVPVSGDGTVFMGAAGGSILGFKHSGLPVFALGGPLRLAAYGRNELLTNQFFLFKAGYLHRLVDQAPILARKIYAIGEFEMGKAYGVVNESRLPNDVAGGFLVETAFGPVLLGGSYGDTGHRKFFFQLGRVF